MEINNPSRLDRCRRRDWHPCPCCAPNVLRTIAGISRFIYTRDEEGIQVNLYASSVSSHTLPDGNTIKLSQETLVLNLPLEARIIRGNPKVASQVNKAAFMRGPLVYCMEQPDNREPGRMKVWIPEE